MIKMTRKKKFGARQNGKKSVVLMIIVLLSSVILTLCNSCFSDEGRNFLTVIFTVVEAFKVFYFTINDQVFDEMSAFVKYKKNSLFFESVNLGLELFALTVIISVSAVSKGNFYCSIVVGFIFSTASGLLNYCDKKEKNVPGEKNISQTTQPTR